MTQRNKKNTCTPRVRITIGAQTESSSKVGQGLKPLNPLIVNNPFDDITIEKDKIPGEAFIAEAIKNDFTSNKIRRLIELQDWTAIKNFSKYWYNLRRELSINLNGCICMMANCTYPPK